MEQHSQTEVSGQMSFEEQEEAFEWVVEKMLTWAAATFCKMVEQIPEHVVECAVATFVRVIKKKKEHFLVDCGSAEQAVKFIETSNFSDYFKDEFYKGSIDGLMEGLLFCFLCIEKGKEEALKFAEMVEIPHEKACSFVQFFEQMKH